MRETYIVKSGEHSKNEDLLFYTVEEICELFKIGKTTAYRLVSSPGFPQIKINKKILIPRKDLDRWISQNLNKEYLF